MNQKYLPLPDLTPLLVQKQKRLEEDLQGYNDQLMEVQKAIEQAMSNSSSYKIRLETENQRRLNLEELTSALEKTLEDLRKRTAMLSQNSLKLQKEITTQNRKILNQKKRIKSSLLCLNDLPIILDPLKGRRTMNRRTQLKSEVSTAK